MIYLCDYTINTYIEGSMRNLSRGGARGTAQVRFRKASKYALKASHPLPGVPSIYHRFL
jgi:hypothetical protein